MNKNLITMLIIGGSIVLAITLISLGERVDQPTTGGHGAGSLLAPPSNSNGQPSIAALVSSYPTLGDENAPVELVEFGDYQCTFCAKFFKETESALIKKYVDTGILKIKFKDYPINGSESQAAALGASCANDQGRFWDYHDKLFNERKGYQAGVFTEENLISFAGELGLDSDQFTECYQSGKFRSQVAKDLNDARLVGAKGTPTFFLNGQSVPGAQPLEFWELAIQQMLDS